MNILEIHYLPRVCLTHRISLISLSKAGQFFTHFFVQEAGYLVKEKFSFGDSWMAEIQYLLLCHCACVLSLRSLQIIFTELLAWLHITSQTLNHKWAPKGRGSKQGGTMCAGVCSLTLKISWMLLSMNATIRSSLSFERVVLWMIAFEKDFFTTSRFSN